MRYRLRNRRRGRSRRVRWGRIMAVLFALTGMVFGGVKLIGYGVDLIASRRTAQELREVYYAVSTLAPAVTDTPSTPTAVLENTPVLTAAPSTPPAAATQPPTIPTLSPNPRLPSAAYPSNPRLEISNRFRHLRRESKDIVGWLTLEHLIDEPVVQRNNVFFLDHDAKGRQNVNGAIFLDAAVSLKARPYTYILYGHNMKSGAMFGNLRNFEKASFYHAQPFLAFDTLYEEGRYVIFAVGNISVEEYGRHYVDFYALKSTGIAERKTAINTLIAASVHTCTIDVQPEDQLLLLVTCVENDAERRVVAARRVRDGENEKELKKLAERSRKK